MDIITRRGHEFSAGRTIYVHIFWTDETKYSSVRTIFVPEVIILAFNIVQP